MFRRHRYLGHSQRKPCGHQNMSKERAHRAQKERLRKETAQHAVGWEYARAMRRFDEVSTTCTRPAHSTASRPQVVRLERSTCAIGAFSKCCTHVFFRLKLLGNSTWYRIILAVAKHVVCMCPHQHDNIAGWLKLCFLAAPVANLQFAGWEKKGRIRPHFDIATCMYALRSTRKDLPCITL